MQRENIFISHSAHKATDKQTMDTLIKLLEDDGFHVYCDKERLKIGDAWRKELYSAISRCQAAVVLITQEALDIEKYPWVFKECSMFTMIKYKDSQFPIIPITMSDVTIEDIKNSPFKALQLDEIMAGSHQDLDSVINTIRAKLSKAEYLDENKPLYYHHKRIAFNLPIPSPENEEILKNVIKKLDPKRSNPWSYLDKGIRYEIAGILLSLDPDELIKELENSLWDIIVSEKERSIDLIELLVPFWLDFPPITPMEDKVQNEQSDLKKIDPKNDSDSIHKLENYLRTAFGLNAKEEFTGFMYVMRAGYMKSKTYFVRPLPDNVAINDIEEYSGHIKSIIKRGPLALETRRIKMPHENDIIKNIVIKGAQDPIFIILPYGTDKRVLEELRRRFRTIIFVALIGQDDFRKWDIPKFEKLAPSLKDGMESQFCDWYERALTNVNLIIGVSGRIRSWEDKLA
jgi:hypothetical protein